MNNSQEIKTQIIMLASFAGRDLNPMMIQGYMDAVSDLDPSSVLAALKDWLKTSKGFPHPSDIREKIKPEINPSDDALDVANLVIAAIGSCGYTNFERAKEKIGELGWTVVTRMGGWKHLCEVIDQDNEGMWRAQIRTYAETVIRKAKRGELEIVPALPTPAGNTVLKLVSGAMKGIGDA